MENAFASNKCLALNIKQQCNLQILTVNYETHKHQTTWKVPIHEKFYQIDNQTVKTPTKNKVLVHCQMGRSRSAIMVIMYLLYKQVVDNLNSEMDSETIVKFVKNRRSVTDPNKGFMMQLEQFEKEIKLGLVQQRVKEYRR